MESLKIIICVGVPASGKSYWSTEFVAKNPKYVRINRDSYRFMLKNEPFCEPKIESLITDLSYHAIDAALAKKLNVVLDNTHVKRDVILDIIDRYQYKADIEFRVFDISLDKALERDKQREKTVGEEVLKRMYKEYKILIDSFVFQNVSQKVKKYSDPVSNPALPDIVLFDIDGTLAHMNGKRGPFEWHRVDVDDLDGIVFDAYKRHQKLGDKIGILSGRSSDARKKTEEWLEFYGITGYEFLYMRGSTDFRKDNAVKQQIYEERIKPFYNVKVIYDDRDQVVKMWRSLGLKCFQVAEGDF
jgi:predicted kinase